MESSAIQDWIDAASVVGGGVVLLDQGINELSEPLRIGRNNRGVHIIGAAMPSREYDGPSGGTVLAAGPGFPADSALVEIDGDGEKLSVALWQIGLDARGIAKHCIRIKAATDVDVDGALLFGATGHGMLVGGASSNQLYLDRVHAYRNGGDGICCNSLGDSHFGRITAYSNEGCGLRLLGGTVVQDLHAYCNGQHGLWMQATANPARNHVAYVRADQNGGQGVLVESEPNTIAFESCVGNGGVTAASRGKVIAPK